MGKSMMRVGATWGAALATAGVGLMAGAAHASVYNWTFTPQRIGTDPSGSGQLTVALGAITAISGTFDGSSISALLGPGGFNSNDNAFPLDSFGVSFSLSNADLANMAPSNTLVFDGTINHLGYGTFAATTAVPEPATWVLLGAGAAGLLGVRGRRRRATALVA